MFERFTDDARQVVVLAREEAILLETHYIGTEHLLLGVLRVDDAIAARALRSLHLSADPIRRRIDAIAGPKEGEPTGHIHFTWQAKESLGWSLREALQLDHQHIGPEHIVLGVTHEPDDVAVQVLEELGVEPRQVRAAVMATLAERTDGDPLA